MNRRQLLRTTGLGLVGGAFAETVGPSASAADVKGHAMSLSLADYEPKSMLQVRETHIEKARFPASVASDIGGMVSILLGHD